MWVKIYTYQLTNLPAGHGKQEVEPTLSWYDPAAHGTG